MMLNVMKIGSTLDKNGSWFGAFFVCLGMILLLLSASPAMGRHSGFSISICSYLLHPPPSFVSHCHVLSNPIHASFKQGYSIYGKVNGLLSLVSVYGQKNDLCKNLRIVFLLCTDTTPLPHPTNCTFETRDISRAPSELFSATPRNSRMFRNSDWATLH